MYILANMMQFQKLMRQFFFNIDKIVFNFISAIYDVLITIARTSVLSQADIIDMASRIYRLLAVFMVFKVTFSLIMYVVNPDDFSDKSKGVGKLGTNIVISLALLILVPYIFSYAYQLQTIILEDNSLSALVFGDQVDNMNENPFNDAGSKIAYITLSPFFTPNVGLDGLYDCSRLTVTENSNVSFNSACRAALETFISDDNFEEQTLRNYEKGVELGNLGLMFRQNMAIATNKNDSEFIMDYKFGISTVVGVIIILVLATFCLDVALRSVKLAFLQLVAPIPIISYVDPKSGKDGMFKKWYQMCYKTYLSLFIRLLALYFAVYIINRIDRMVDIVDGSYVSNAIIKVLVIIGALMFAKQFTKILEGLGIKLDGKFYLNPIKKFQEETAGGKQILSAGGALAAGAAAFGTNFIAAKGWRKLVSPFAGAFSATGRGLINSRKGEGFGKNFSNSYGSAMKARNNRDDRRELGVSMADITRQRVRQAMNLGTTDQIQDAQMKRYDEAINAGKAAKSRAEGEIDKKADMIMTATGETLGALRDRVEALKNINASDYARTHRGPGGRPMTEDEAATEIARLSSAANSAYFKARKAATNDYISNAAAGTLSTTTAFGGAAGSVFDSEDVIVRTNVAQMESATAKYDLKDSTGTNVSVNRNNLGNTIQTLEDAKTTITTSDEYRNAHLVAEQTKKQK